MCRESAEVFFVHVGIIVIRDWIVICLALYIYMKVCNVRKKISDRAGRVISISMRLTDLQFLIKNVKQIISRDVILKCISYFMNIDEKIRQL